MPLKKADSVRVEFVFSVHPIRFRKRNRWYWKETQKDFCRNRHRSIKNTPIDVHMVRSNVILNGVTGEFRAYKLRRLDPFRTVFILVLGKIPTIWLWILSRSTWFIVFATGRVNRLKLGDIFPKQLSKRSKFTRYRIGISDGRYAIQTFCVLSYACEYILKPNGRRGCTVRLYIFIARFAIRSSNVPCRRLCGTVGKLLMLVGRREERKG